MLTQFGRILSGLNVYPGRMKRNLEMTGGLVFSQPIMLALTESGLDRQVAYKIVQSTPWKSGTPTQAASQAPPS